MVCLLTGMNCYRCILIFHIFPQCIEYVSSTAFFMVACLIFHVMLNFVFSFLISKCFDKVLFFLNIFHD